MEKFKIEMENGDYGFGNGKRPWMRISDWDRVGEMRMENKEWAKLISLTILAKLEGSLDLSSNILSITAKFVRESCDLFKLISHYFKINAILRRHRNNQSTIFGQFCPRGKGAVRLSLCEAPIRATRPDPNTGNYVPYSFQLVCGLFNVPN